MRVRTAVPGILLTLGFALSACVDPGYAVHGRLRAPTDLSAAKVHVMCRGERRGDALEVQADGIVADQNKGTMPRRCTLHIDASGYAPEDLRVADVCTRRGPRGRCEDTSFDVTLRPTTAVDARP